MVERLFQIRHLQEKIICQKNLRAHEAHWSWIVATSIDFKRPLEYLTYSNHTICPEISKLLITSKIFMITLDFHCWKAYSRIKNHQKILRAENHRVLRETGGNIVKKRYLSWLKIVRHFRKKPFLSFEQQFVFASDQLSCSEAIWRSTQLIDVDEAPNNASNASVQRSLIFLFTASKQNRFRIQCQGLNICNLTSSHCNTLCNAGETEKSFLV